METLGKLENRLIRRFGELSKNEIQIILTLLISKHAITGKCDPGRKQIGEITGIAKTNLSRAIASLIAKGWISESIDGFELIFEGIPPIKKPDRSYQTDNFPPVEKPVESYQTDNFSPVEKSPKPVEKPVESYQTDNRKSYQTDNFSGRAHIRNILREDLKPRKRIKSNTPKPEKPAKTPIRIPSDFHLTDSMKSWFIENVSKLRETPEDATADFIEYWTNRADKKSLAIDWFLRWKKGMRLLLKWQNEKDNETRAAMRVGSNR